MWSTESFTQTRAHYFGNPLISMRRSFAPSKRGGFKVPRKQPAPGEMQVPAPQSSVDTAGKLKLRPLPRTKGPWLVGALAQHTQAILHVNYGG